jgi:aminopeptidase N
MTLLFRPAARALTLLLLAACPPTPMLAQEGPPTDEPPPIEAGRPAPPDRYDGAWDVLHYDVELGLGESEAWIAGRAALRVRAARGGAGEIGLDLTGLAVDSVTVDGAAVEWEHASGRLVVALPEPLPQGGEARVEVRYRGVPDDGLILGENVHGQRSAFADNWPDRARFWFPSVDHPSDKATVRFTVHAPAAWEVVANGRLVGQPFPSAPDAIGPDAATRRTWIWATDVPTPTYTMVVGAAPLSTAEVGLAACGRAPASSRPDGCVEVSTWLFPESVEAASPSFERAADMVDFFSEVVGPYPYEKLAHVQSSTRFGGMENSSAIFYAERSLAAGRDIEGTVSHETAHQWFGDSVTEADWSHVWLSEGFATYFGAVYFEYADGPDALRERMAGAEHAYLAAGDTLRPVLDTEATSLFDLLNSNSYSKGAWVLHMLRNVVGDETFFQGIREYYARHRDSTALTGDLRAVMEEVSGRELAWFFEQWLERPGYPVLRVESEAAASSGQVEVGVRQVQGEYAPRFRFPLELELRWQGGSRRERVEITGAEATFRFDAGPGPVEVVVDPDLVLLKRVER